MTGLWFRHLLDPGGQGKGRQRGEIKNAGLGGAAVLGSLAGVDVKRRQVGWEKPLKVGNSWHFLHDSSTRRGRVANTSVLSVVTQTYSKPTFFNTLPLPWCNDSGALAS